MTLPEFLEKCKEKGIAFSRMPGNRIEVFSDHELPQAVLDLVVAKKDALLKLIPPEDDEGWGKLLEKTVEDAKAGYMPVADHTSPSHVEGFKGVMVGAINIWNPGVLLLHNVELLEAGKYRWPDDWWKYAPGRPGPFKNLYHVLAEVEGIVDWWATYEGERPDASHIASEAVLDANE